MVERPQRSEDERPLHMWAPSRPHWGGEEGRQLTRACLPISAGWDRPALAASPRALWTGHQPTRT